MFKLFLFVLSRPALFAVKSFFFHRPAQILLSNMFDFIPVSAEAFVDIFRPPMTRDMTFCPPPLTAYLKKLFQPLKSIPHNPLTKLFQTFICRHIFNLSQLSVDDLHVFIPSLKRKALNEDFNLNFWLKQFSIKYNIFTCFQILGLHNIFSRFLFLK